MGQATSSYGKVETGTRVLTPLPVSASAPLSPHTLPVFWLQRRVLAEIFHKMQKQVKEHSISQSQQISR